MLRILTFAVLALLVSSPALAWDMTVGWLQADLALQDKDPGLYVGVQEAWSVGDGPFVFVGAAEYQLRKGTQAFYYTSQSQGLFEDEGTVSLHCLQPTGFLGLDLPVGEMKVRFYTGASLYLKMSESWDEPDGGKGMDLGYEDIDVQGHLGVSLHLDRFLVDGRYSAGLMDQLVYRDDDVLPGNKAGADDLPGDGGKISVIQIGGGFSF